MKNQVFVVNLVISFGFFDKSWTLNVEIPPNPPEFKVCCHFIWLKSENSAMRTSWNLNFPLFQVIPAINIDKSIFLITLKATNASSKLWILLQYSSFHERFQKFLHFNTWNLTKHQNHWGSLLHFHGILKKNRYKIQHFREVPRNLFWYFWQFFGDFQTTKIYLDSKPSAE